MTIHYNFYESLDIDRDSSTSEIREELTGRLDSLRREGVPEYDPKVQEAATALNVLGDDDKRALHDERLDDPLAPRMGIAELRTLATTGSFPGAAAAPSAPGAPAGIRPASYPTPSQTSSDDAPKVVGTPGAAGTPVGTHETEADDDTDSESDSTSASADDHGVAGMDSTHGVGSGATATGLGAAAGASAAAAPYGSGSYGSDSAEPSPAYYAPAGQHSGPQAAYAAPQQPGAQQPQQPGAQQQFPAAPPKPKAPKAPENPDNPSLVGLVTRPPTVVKILGGILAANTVIATLAMLIAFFNVGSEDWNTGFGYMGDVIAIGASAAVVPFLGIALASAFLLPRVLKGRDNGTIIPLVATGAIFTMFVIALAVTYGGTMTKLLMILLAITHIAMIVLAFIPDTRAWFNGTWTPAPATPSFPQQGGYPQQGQNGRQPQQFGAPQGQTGQYPQYGAQPGQPGQPGQQFGTQQPGQ